MTEKKPQRELFSPDKPENHTMVGENGETRMKEGCTFSFYNGYFGYNDNKRTRGGGGLVWRSYLFKDPARYISFLILRGLFLVSFHDRIYFLFLVQNFCFFQQRALSLVYLEVM